MQAIEIGAGANRKVMPDTVKILDPKVDDDKEITPTVISQGQEEQAAQEQTNA